MKAILGCLLAVVVMSVVAKPVRAADEPIKIGVLLSTTGVVGFIGDPEQKAVELYIKKVNDAGGVLGRKIELVSYDDASEPEMDATDAYYAKLRANKGKRMTPEGGYASPRAGVQGKKMRSVYEATAQVQTFVEENGRMVPAMGAGSDAGWTDEDAF